MTTASKYGNEDLNGNSNIYQQLVAPLPSKNIVATANFANKNPATAASVRLALTSVPLIPQLVAATNGSIDFPVKSSTTGTNLITTRSLAVSSVDDIMSITAAHSLPYSGIYTTKSLTVTATTVTTNLITCTDTASLAVNMPVVFSVSQGNLMVGATYYVLTIASTTSFTVSSTMGGTVFPLLTTTGTFAVQQTTATLALNQTVTFNSPNNNIGQTLTISATTVSSNLITTGGFIVNATVVSGNTIWIAPITTIIATTLASPIGANIVVCTNTNVLSVNMPIVLRATVGTMIGDTVYFVKQIIDSVTFTVSATLNGVTFTQAATTAQAGAVQYAGPNLNVNQPITFGTTQGNLVAGTTYYVYSVLTPYTFTVSAAIGGTQFVVTATATNMVCQYVVIGSLVLNQPITFSNMIQGVNAININGPMPLTSGLNFGGLSDGATYYVKTLDSSTTFTVSATLVAGVAGPALALATAATTALTLNQTVAANLMFNGVMSFRAQPPVISRIAASSVIPGNTYLPIAATTVTTNIITTASFQISDTVIGTNLISTLAISISSTATSTNILTTGSTTSLQLNQPVSFFFTTAVNCGLIANQVYYIKTLDTANTFTVSVVPSGAAVALTTTVVGFTMRPALTNQAVNQPITFSSSVGGLTSGQTYYIKTIDNLFQFTVSSTLIPLTIGAVPVAGPVLALTTTTGGTVIVVNSTALLALNQPIVFHGPIAGVVSMGGLIAKTVYYIKTIDTAGTFTVSASLVAGVASTVATLSTATGQLWLVAATIARTTPALTIAGQVQPIAISDTTAGTNLITTAGILCTATWATTNLIWCTSTSALVVGQPVTFSMTQGNLVAGTVYYVYSIITSTQFSVSAGPLTAQFTLATTFNWINTQGQQIVRPATTNLGINTPIVFNTTFGGLLANVTYYTRTLDTVSQFTVSATVNGPVLPLLTATGPFTGSSTFTPFERVGNTFLPITNTTAIGSILTTSFVNCTASTTGTNYLTCDNTMMLAINMPVVFTSVFGGIVVTTIYYIKSIDSNTMFTISATLGGAVFALTTATGTMPCYAAITNLQINQPVVFNGPSFGGIVAGTVYYIKSLLGNNNIQFTISATIGGPLLTLTDVTAVMTMTMQPATSIANTAYYVNSIPSSTSFSLLPVPTTMATSVFSATITGTSVTVNGITSGVIQVGMIISGSGVTPNSIITALGTGIGGVGTYTITPSQTVGTFIIMTGVMQPAVLPLATGEILVNTTSDKHQFTMSAIAVTATTTGTNYVTCGNTATLATGTAIQFSGALGGLFPNITYWVLSVFSGTQFTCATAPGGPQAVLSTTTALLPINVRAISDYTVGQAITFVGTQYAGISLPITSTAAGTNALVMAAIAVSATSGVDNYITCASTTSLTLNAPVVFSLAGTNGGITGGTVYYVQEINSGFKFAISTVPGGGVFAISTNSPVNQTVSLTTGQLVLNQIVMFTTTLGTLLGGSTPQVSYWVNSIDSLLTFTVAATLNGPVVPMVNATGTTTLQLATVIPTSPYYVQSIPNALTFTVSQSIGGPILNYATSTTAGSNLITTAYSTSMLYTNMPVNFNSSMGNLFRGITYYVQTIIRPVDISIGITNTTTSTNIVTCTNTSVLSVNMPIYFSATAGGLTGGTLYYVKTIPTFTTFTVSASIVNGVTGAAVTLSTTTPTMNAYPTFPCRFTVSTTISGPVVQLSDATGYVSFVNPLTPSISLGLASASGALVCWNTTDNLVINQPIAFLNSPITVIRTSGTTLTTNMSTSLFDVNHPIMFNSMTSQMFGGLSNRTVYYVKTIDSISTFTISLTSGGTALALDTGNGVMHVHDGIDVLAPLTTYYVKTKDSYNTFTVSTSAGGAVVPLGNTNQIATVLNNIVTLAAGSTANLVVKQPLTFQGSDTTNVINSSLMPTATNLGGAYTVSSLLNTLTLLNSTTAKFVLNQPVVFSTGLLGGLVAGTTYYIRTIDSTTTFTLGLTPGYNAVIAVTTGMTAGGMLPAYYFAAALSPTQFIISATPAGVTFGGGTSLTLPVTSTAAGSAPMVVKGLPEAGDFLEMDTSITNLGAIERTGILIPSGCFLYAASNIANVTVVSTGLSETV